MLERLKSLWANAKSIVGKINNEKSATGIMRWPRPVAFFLITTMFIVGWFNAPALLAFATALSAFPPDFWNVIFIILGSIAGSKVLKDASELLKK